MSLTIENEQVPLNAVLSYYLRRKQEIEVYLRQREHKAEDIRQHYQTLFELDGGWHYNTLKIFREHVEVIRVKPTMGKSEVLEAVLLRRNPSMAEACEN